MHLIVKKACFEMTLTNNRAWPQLLIFLDVRHAGHFWNCEPNKKVFDEAFTLFGKLWSIKKVMKYQRCAIFPCKSVGCCAMK
jgi:hypothetical protein